MRPTDDPSKLLSLAARHDDAGTPQQADEAPQPHGEAPELVPVGGIMNPQVRSSPELSAAINGQSVPKEQCRQHASRAHRSQAAARGSRTSQQSSNVISLDFPAQRSRSGPPCDAAPSRRPQVSAADAACWLAYLRAIETQRADALFRDHLALRIAGGRGEFLTKMLAALAQPELVAVRTHFFDERVLEAVERDNVTAVLDLGAGFDARPYRLSLPAGLSWIEVDSLEIIRAKSLAFAREKASCTVERFAFDVTHRESLRALLAGIAKKHSRVFVITEGVLAHLAETAVSELVDNLHACRAVTSWAFELQAAEAQAIDRQVLREAHQVFGFEMSRCIDRTFAPANGIDFFAERGWRQLRVIPIFMEQLLWGRLPSPHLRLLQSLTAAQRQSLLERNIYAVVRR